MQRRTILSALLGNALVTGQALTGTAWAQEAVWPTRPIKMVVPFAAGGAADVGARLIHGDWRFDNLVLDSNSLAPVAVLDWELATVGDPLMDLGAALAYWVQPDDDDFFQGFRRQPSNAPGMPTRAQIVARYLERTGYPCDDWRFYEVFGLFRLAVIAQQIWYRYSRGETSNPAFRQFGPAVDYLMWRCADRIGSPTSPRR